MTPSTRAVPLTCLVQRDRGAVGVVVVRDDHGPVARRHRVVDEVVPHRRGEHHPRQVVAGEGERPLDRAGRRHDLPRADLPEPVARPLGAGHVVGQALHGEDVAVVVDARPHRAGAQADVVHPEERPDLLLDPGLGRNPADHRAVHRRPAAPVRRLLDEEDGAARLAGRARGGEPRDSPADHKDIDVDVEVFVGVGVARLGRSPEPCRLANEGLVDVLPEAPRMDEHLVVEARGQEPREKAVHRAHVPFEARPVVLAPGGKSFEKLGDRGALVGLEPGALAQRDERVRLLGPACHDAAGAVVLEGAPDEHMPRAEERGGERVARVALQTPAVEAEVERLGAVDQAAAGGKAEAHRAVLSSILLRTSSGGSAVWAM